LGNPHFPANLLTYFKRHPVPFLWGITRPPSEPSQPLGQTLIVTAGGGRAQREGGPIEEIRPGDIIWVPPGEKHWHGAAPTTSLTHIAIQEARDGKAGFLFLAKASPLFVTFFS